MQDAGSGKPDSAAKDPAPPTCSIEKHPPASPSPPSIWGRLFQDAQNAVTVLGAMATTGAAAILLVYFVVDLLWGFANPYVSLVVYLLLPAAFILGLLLIPIGIWRTRRRRARCGENRTEQPYPVIDFNDRRVRVTWSVVIVLTFVNLAILGIAAYKALEYTDSIEFCGSLCHTVMHPQRVSHADSPHARVPCVDCHIGAGASWFVQSKLSGLRQVWAVATGSYSRPIPTPVENLRPARETCEACHWPQKFYGDRLVVRTHYAPDETNTATRTMLLIKTGGGDPKLGLHGGIHWFHMERQHEIRFLPADARQQSVAWIRYRTPGGEVFEFSHPQLSPAPGAESRVMDCVTCHNQPTHGFHPPSEALDLAIETGRIDASFPFIKREALVAVTASFDGEARARADIAEALLAFYRLQYPDLARTRADALDSAVRAVGDVWTRNVFPEMKIGWGTYPDNTGHPRAAPVPEDHAGRTNESCTMCHALEAADTQATPAIPHPADDDTDCLSCHVAGNAVDPGFPGCFRCHNDQMQMTTGPRPLSIATRCSSCHYMWFLGKGDLVVPHTFLGLP